MNWLDGENLENPEVIGKIESDWNVELPSSFKRILLDHNGGYPEINVFDTDSSIGRVFGALLNFDLTSANNVLRHYENLRDVLPKNSFPFAIDPGGNYLCFSYSNSGNPDVIFWNHEGLLENDQEVHEHEFVAHSFDLFIEKLYKPDDEEESDFSNFEMLD